MLQGVGVLLQLEKIQVGESSRGDQRDVGKHKFVREMSGAIERGETREFEDETIIHLHRTTF